MNTRTDSAHHPLLRHSVTTQILALSWPALLQQGLLLVIMLYDQYLAGDYSPAHQAALTTANYLHWFASSYAVVVNAGASAVVGRLVGAGDIPGARRATAQSLLLAILFGLVGMFASLAFLPELIEALKLVGEPARHTHDYLKPLALGMPFYMIEVASVACLVGAGDTRTGLKVLLTAVLCNIPLANGLAFGAFGIEGIGFTGIAYGTAISHGIACLFVLNVLARGRYGLKLIAANFVPSREWIYRLLRISIPAAVDCLSTSVFQLCFLRIVNRLGETAAAAHGIALRLEGLGYLTGVAFGTASASFMSRALGASMPELAKRGGRVALVMGVVMMSFMGLLFFFLAEGMFRIFCNPSQQGDVIATGVPVLRLVAFAMPGLASGIVLVLALRGVGDTRIPLIFSWVGFLGIRLPLAEYLCHSCDWGLLGAWMAMFADIYVRGAFYLWRFLGGKWVNIRV